MEGEKTPIYLLVGVPCAGKSWVCEQLEDDFEYVHHDGFMGMIDQPEAYVDAIKKAAETNWGKPVLAEAPFSISKIKDPLESDGYEVEPVFIVESDDVISRRYLQRENKPVPKNHLSRMRTYNQRADQWGAFKGTSDEVLRYLRKIGNRSR